MLRRPNERHAGGRFPYELERIGGERDFVVAAEHDDLSTSAWLCCRPGRQQRPVTVKDRRSALEDLAVDRAPLFEDRDKGGLGEPVHRCPRDTGIGEREGRKARRHQRQVLLDETPRRPESILTVKADQQFGRVNLRKLGEAEERALEVLRTVGRGQQDA